MVGKHEACRPERRWTAWVIAVAASFAVLEITGWPDATLSHWCRDRAHTDTPRGRAAFRLGLALAGYGFAQHILDPDDNWLPEG